MNRPRRKKRNRPSRQIEYNQRRHNCFRCMRPKQVCHCDLIPTINNKTEIVIAQHIRERGHPFNTARIVADALANSRIVVDYAENFERHSNLVDADTGILFPSSEALDLCHVEKDLLPKRLLLLDGTWNQAKRMYRKWPAIHGLRHFKICPSNPGRYRIRLEPDDSSLSTIEATVMALKLLEPETAGMDQLLSVFSTMVERQLAHPMARYEAIQRPPTLNIPYKLVANTTPLVLAYGEAEPIRKGSSKNGARQPAAWFAEKLASGKTFKCVLQTREQVSSELLDYFELPETEFRHAVPNEEFKDRWNSFLSPDDLLVVFNASTLRLLSATGAVVNEAICLQSVNYDPQRECKTIREFLTKNDCQIPTPAFSGRAGKRLANLKALVVFLQEKLRQRLSVT